MQTSYLKYSLSNNIHKFVMYKADSGAMDAFFDTLYEVLESLENDAPFYSIYDLTQSGFPSFHHNIVRATRIMKVHNIRRVNRAFVIHNDSHTAQMASVAMNINPFINLKFIRPHEEDHYTKWLLTGHLPHIHHS